MIIYVLAISFQLAGALLLLKNAMSTKREKVIYRFAGRGIIFKNKEGSIEYKKEVFRDVYREAYLSKAAFLVIGIGYILGVFGEMGNNSKIILAIIIGVISLVIIVIAHYIVEVILKHKEKVNREITSEELEMLGIKPDSEELSQDDIEKIWK